MMGNQAGGAGPMSRPPMGQQPQQPFLHLQHPMQASSVPQQQHGAMGLTNGGMPLNVAVQQQQQPPQQFQLPMQGQAAQRPMIPDGGRGFQGLTQQETAMVNFLAKEM